MSRHCGTERNVLLIAAFLLIRYIPHSMAEATSRSPPRASTFRSDFDFTTLITLAGMTAVLFLGGLGITEAIGEIPLDIDWKPFFIIYAIIYFVPWGHAHGGGRGRWWSRRSYRRCCTPRRCHRCTRHHCKCTVWALATTHFSSSLMMHSFCLTFVACAPGCRPRWVASAAAQTAESSTTDRFIQ